MGVDLTICPDSWDAMARGRVPLLHQRLDLTRDYAMWDRINRLPGRPVERAEWYGDDGIETITTDPYGSPLRCCRAADLVGAMGEPSPDTSPGNRAIRAYLLAHDPNLLVLLYWH